MITKTTPLFSSVTIQSLTAAAALCFAFPVGTLHAAPVGSTFTYQGSLTDNGQPANGSYELSITLYDAAVGGSSLGTITVQGVTVTQGVFTTQLDYGAAAFDGNARWLEIAVRLENDGQPAVTLTPRQAITAAPYAQMAKTVPDGAISGAKLANGAVTSAKLAGGAVGAAQIAAGAVTSSHIATGGIEAVNLAAGSVGAAQLNTGAAFQNLAASGQSPVGSGGMIMSQSATAPALLSAGYLPAGRVQLITQGWDDKAPIPDAPSTIELGSMGETSVWTGTELIVWGGRKSTGPFALGGGRYNPTTRTWTAITAVNAPASRQGATAVWTGTEMLVWGGYTGSPGNEVPQGTGARYNPATNVWTPITTTGAPSARYDHSAVWSGAQMIIWGGQGDFNTDHSGARYNPSTNTWTALANTGGPQERYKHQAVWTGSRMLIFSGGQSSGISPILDSYNPTTNSWTSSTYTGPSQIYFAGRGTWTGTELIMGVEESLVRFNPTTSAWTTTPAPNYYFSQDSAAHWTGSQVILVGGKHLFGDSINSAKFTPSTGVLVPVSQIKHPSGTGDVTAWTGSQLLSWGGADEPIGAAYTPGTDTWYPMGGVSEGGSRAQGFTTVWTGKEALLWGGVDGYGTIVRGGRRYNESTNTWTLMSEVNAPAARKNHTSVWTGTEMIVWGGENDSAALDNGGRYNPATNTWTAVNTTGAPSGGAPKAIWTGSEMITVHNSNGGTLYGGRYNPATNTWTPLSTAGAPAARTNFALLWTGTELIVWGGGNLGSGNATGGRFNPTTNTWTATSLVNAPPGRSFPGAVWSGKEMIIFGGGPDFGALPTMNARYNPVTNVWTTLSSAGAPAARHSHSVAWDGVKFLVLGGRDATGAPLNDGAIYHPEDDVWAPVNNHVADGRWNLHAVWTGTSMLVLGGDRSGAADNAGYGYTPERTCYFYARP